MNSIEAYQSSRVFSFTDHYYQIFGGALAWVQTLIAEQALLPALACVVLLFFYDAIEREAPSRWKIHRVLLCFLILNQIFYSFRFGVIWDEFYLNLKHSLTLSEFHTYSFSPKQAVEASVEFLPLYLTGLLNRFFGVPLADALIGFSMLGGVLITLVAYLSTLKVFTGRKIALWLAFVCSTFPCVLGVGGSGFTSTFFLAVILSIYYLLLLQTDIKSRNFGLLLLALLPLFRIEGILFSMLFLPYWAFRQRSSLVQILRFGLLVVTPFALISFYRYLHFGNVIPVPVEFKNVGSSTLFLALGWKQFIEITRIFHLYLFLPICCLGIFFYRRFTWVRDALAFLVILVLFSFPYIWGGGDWIYAIWARYLMPLVLFSCIVALWIFCAWLQTRRWPCHLWFLMSLWIIVLFIAGSVQTAESGWARLFYYNLQSGRKNADISVKMAFAEFVDQTVPENELIGTIELATVAFFSHRETYDMLGLINRDIAKQPLDPMFSSGMDIVPRTFRRRKKGLLDDEKPCLIFDTYVSEFKHCDKNTNAYQHYLSNLQRELTMNVEPPSYRRQGAEYMYYRKDYPEQAGYKFLSATFDNIYFNYWIHDHCYAAHVQKLKNLGFKDPPTIVTY